MKPGLRFARAAILILLALLAFAAVVPGGDFIFDDHVLIERNTDLQHSDVWWRSFARDYYATSEQPGISGYYRPLAVLCNAFDVQVWRSGARGGHITNILLHVAASVSLVAALGALGVPAAAAWVSALLFAVHPSHAESVAFISGRVDVLVTLFVLLAMMAAASLRSRSWIGVGLASFAAFLSKEMSVVLPLLLLIVWQRRATQPQWESAGRATRRGRKTQAGARGWPVAQMLAVAAAVVFMLFLRERALTTLLPSSAHGERPAGAALLPLQSMLFMLSALYAPAKLLVVEPSPAALHVLRLAVGCVVGVGLWVAAWLGVPRSRGALARAAVAGSVTLLPVLNLLPQETQLSERFLYLPSAFLLVPAGVLAAAGWRRGGVASAVTAAAVSVAVVALLGLSSWRASMWRTDVQVWRQAVREEPERAAFWDRLGLARMEQRNYAAAEQAMRRAVQLDPRLFNGWFNLGALYEQRRRYPEAIEAYRTALQFQPRSVGARVGLGRALARSRDFDAAYDEFVAALQVKPDHLDARRWAGMTALQTGDLQSAEVHLRAAQRLAPNDRAVQQALRKLQQRRGD
ncbi:MAG: tetratricopeptide repeat protein [Candidatus Latescibacterota bacterium]|nr:MAG: tetratricopeptide repeat protein [Candidatus Latescibacterota bacterium]